ncbi:phosphotransferase family protein [Paractinoplanes atraurantiacus]|uniref:Phosphotransferase enzyme family protein n=1 Tax=Paractinoplanes atraurantiacus TaxID=1036182 RepID=A0A285K1C0_9ACTN|nr:aminoglycoside phosphotransferase family protein [Actinoplanes atraurantiacus]SNY66392.1 Phosphotransferase enzyme family protein [Actinoplanes atraurantiacus]
MSVDAGVRWAESVWGRRVTGVRPLTGGWTSTVVRLDAEDGERSVLRLMTKEPWRQHAPGLLGREAAILDRLAPTAIPVARSLGLDVIGAEAGVPAHLMSWLPGRLRLEAGGDVLAPLARMLAEIHQIDERPRDFQSWAPPSKRVVPLWTRRPALWERAFRVLDEPSPEFQGTFLHRDFHLGNVLWSGNEITGVVDWVEASWGPAHLDVAHAATYLAMLHGLEAAIEFSPHADEYWTVMDVVGYLPDPAKVAQPWRDCGLDVSDDLARRRLDQWLGHVLR